jgi:anti-sigma factor RsiW
VHPDSDLIAYLQDELSPADRERVAGHLAVCSECRGAHDDFRELLARLPASLGQPPAVHWGRFRAELRNRLEATGAVRRPRRRWSAWAAVSLAAAAGLAALVVFMGGPSGPTDLTSNEQVVLGRRLDLIQDYPVVERLELLEDLDVIGQLDRLEAGSES